MNGSLKLGQVFGIPIRLHWSFSLLLIYMAYAGRNYGYSINGILWLLGFILTIFLCVILHELGHAIAAKYFGIETQSIDILPIGGVASLKTAPKKPIEEFSIALAGPLMNGLIALCIFPFLLWLIPNGLRYFDSINPYRDNFLLLIFATNILLAVSNLIPAFPMDGSRVLRAILSMKMSRYFATGIVFFLSACFSLFLILWGMNIIQVPGLNTNPILILIGGFFLMSARKEFQHVQVIHRIGASTIDEVMDKDFLLLKKEDRLLDASKALVSNTAKDYLVVDENNDPVGMLAREDILQKVTSSPQQTIGEIMENRFHKLRPIEKVNEIYFLMAHNHLRTLPVFNDTTLVGMLYFDDLRKFVEAKKKGK